MVLVSVDLFDNDVGPILRQLFEHFQEVALDTRIQDIPPVFGWPYEVVVTGKDKVAHSTVRGHTSIVAGIRASG